MVLQEGPSRFTCAPEADLKEFPSVPTQSIKTPSSMKPPSVLDKPIPYVHTQGPPPSEKYDSPLGRSDLPPNQPDSDSFPPQVSKLVNEKPQERGRRHSLGSVGDLNPERRDLDNERKARRESDVFPAKASQGWDQRASGITGEVRGRAPSRDAPTRPAPSLHANRASTDLDKPVSATNVGVHFNNNAKNLQSSEGHKGRNTPAPVHNPKEYESDEYTSLSDGDFNMAPSVSKAVSKAGLEDISESEDSEEEDSRPVKKEMAQQTSSRRRQSNNRAINWQQSDLIMSSESDDSAPYEGSQGRGSRLHPPKDNLKNGSRRPLNSEKEEVAQGSSRMGTNGRNTVSYVQSHSKSDYRQSQKGFAEQAESDVEEYSPRRVNLQRNTEPQFDGKYKRDHRQRQKQEFAELEHDEDVEESTSRRGSNGRKMGLQTETRHKGLRRQSQMYDDDDEEFVEQVHEPDAFRQKVSRKKGSGQTKLRPSADDYSRSKLRSPPVSDDEIRREGSQRKGFTNARTDKNVYNRVEPSHFHDSEEEIIDEVSRRKSYGKVRSKDDVYRTNGSHASHDKETFKGEGSQGRSSGRRSRTTAEEYHKTFSGKSYNSDDSDEVHEGASQRGKASHAKGTIGKVKPVHDGYHDQDQTLFNSKARGKPKSSHQESERVRGFSNHRRESELSSSSGYESPGYSKGSKGAAKVTNLQPEEHGRYENVSHGSEDDAILPPYGSTKAGGSYGSKYDHSEMSSVHEEGNVPQGMPKLRSQVDDFQNINPGRARGYEDYPPTSGDGGSQRGAGRVKTSYLDGGRDRSLFNEPEEDTAEQLREGSRNLRLNSSHTQGQRYGRGNPDPDGPKFDDELEGFEDIFISKPKTKKYQSSENNGLYGSESTSGKRMSLPGGLSYEKTKLQQSNKGRGDVDVYEDFPSTVDRRSVRRYTVGGEELRADVNRESGHELSKTRAAVSLRAYEEDSQAGENFEDSLQAKKLESKNFLKPRPRARDPPYVASERRDDSVERDRQGKSSNASRYSYNNDDEDVLPRTPNLGKLRVGRQPSSVDASGYEDASPGGGRRMWASRGEKSQKSVDSPRRSELVPPPSNRVRSNLAHAKAPSDSWAQQKVTLPDPRRTVSAAEEDIPDKPKIVKLPDLANFYATVQKGRG